MAAVETKFPVFQYNQNKFNFTVNNNNIESEFDLLLKKKWETGKNENIFRYQLNITEWKRLAGKFEFLAQVK